MLSDRSYFKETASERASASLVRLISVLIAAFLIELVVVAPWFPVRIYLPHHFGHSVAAFTELRLWTIGTHVFVHSTDNLLHIIGVVTALILLGRELLPFMGARRFIGVFFGAAVTGALVWTAVTWQERGILVGGVAGVYGLLVLFVYLNPRLELGFMLFFFVPVTIKIRHAALALGVLSFCGSLYFDIIGATLPFGYAPSAHLGGMLFGAVYFYVVYAEKTIYNAPSRWLPFLFAQPAKPSGENDPGVGYGSSALERDPIEIRAEVDRILDKINSTGISSLSYDEKQLLDKAKRLTNGR